MKKSEDLTHCEMDSASLSLRQLTHIDPHKHKENLPSAFSKSIQVTLRKDVSRQEIERFIAQSIQVVQQWVTEHKGIVGHIKALLEDEDLLWASSTGTRAEVRRIPNRAKRECGKATYYFTAIAVQVDCAAFREVCEKACENCLEQCFEIEGRIDA